MTDQYVVKVRRNHHGREATSVLCAPTSLEDAQRILATRYTLPYQSNQYYLERWDS